MTSRGTAVVRAEMTRRITDIGPEPFLNWPSLAFAADRLWHDWHRIQTGQTLTGQYVYAYHRDNVWCAFNANQHNWPISWARKDHIARWYALVSLFKTDQIVFADNLADLVEQAVRLGNDDSCGGWAIAASALLTVDHPEAEAARTLAALGGLGGVQALDAQRTKRMDHLREIVADSFRRRAPSSAASTP